MRSHDWPAISRQDWYQIHQRASGGRKKVVLAIQQSRRHPLLLALTGSTMPACRQDTTPTQNSSHSFSTNPRVLKSECVQKIWSTLKKSNYGFNRPHLLPWCWLWLGPWLHWAFHISSEETTVPDRYVPLVPRTTDKELLLHKAR